MMNHAKLIIIFFYLFCLSIHLLQTLRYEVAHHHPGHAFIFIITFNAIFLLFLCWALF
jgi:hypothetical protein